MITVDINKAKEIAHGIRRAKREQEFEPLDAIIMKQIPGNNTEEVEAARQAIRDKYATIQTQIDAATTVDALKAALPE